MSLYEKREDITLKYWPIAVTIQIVPF
jgi:hypothetical protein